MRRKDREITSFSEKISVMEKCDVCRIAMKDDDYPYIVPVNFGFEYDEDGSVVIYIHGAATGKKVDLLRRDPSVAFEMDCEHALAYDQENRECSMYYASVIGTGKVSFIEGNDKIHALRVLMKHYHPDEELDFDMRLLPATVVLRIDVCSLTGKRKRRI